MLRIMQEADVVVRGVELPLWLVSQMEPLVRFKFRYCLIVNLTGNIRPRPAISDRF